MLFRLRVALTIAAAPIAACTSAPPERVLVWGSAFEWGPHPVGFRSETLSRPATDASTRSLTLSVWYPARSDGPRMPLRDFLSLALDQELPNESQRLPLDLALAATTTGDSTAIPRDSAGRALAAHTLSTRDAQPAPGPFPMVLWGARSATVLAQAPLAELLASHGFVVVTVWSTDPPLAFLWEGKPAAEMLATLAAQTEDLRYALERLRADPTVDARRIVMLAWSYGGQTAARIQQTDDAVRAVISLDANVVPARPEESLRLRRPLVWLLGRDTTRRGYERVDTLGAPVLVARLPQLEHGNFNAMESHLPVRLGADTLYAWSRGGDVGTQGYEALARMVLPTVRAFQEDSVPSLDSLAVQLRRVAGQVTAEISVRR